MCNDNAKEKTDPTWNSWRSTQRRILSSCEEESSGCQHGDGDGVGSSAMSRSVGERDLQARRRVARRSTCGVERVGAIRCDAMRKDWNEFGSRWAISQPFEAVLNLRGIEASTKLTGDELTRPCCGWATIGARWRWTYSSHFRLRDPWLHHTGKKVADGKIRNQFLARSTRQATTGSGKSSSSDYSVTFDHALRSPCHLFNYRCHVPLPTTDQHTFPFTPWLSQLSKSAVPAHGRCCSEVGWNYWVTEWHKNCLGAVQTCFNIGRRVGLSFSILSICRRNNDNNQDKSLGCRLLNRYLWRNLGYSCSLPAPPLHQLLKAWHTNWRVNWCVKIRDYTFLFLFVCRNSP